MGVFLYLCIHPMAMIQWQLATSPTNIGISPVTSTNAEPTTAPTHTLGGTLAPADAISQAVPVSAAAQHQPSLPTPAQTEQLQAGEHPNLPEQPQHPVNPSQLIPQQLGNPHLSTDPMNPLPHLLLNMPLEPQQSTGKKKARGSHKKDFRHLSPQPLHPQSMLVKSIYLSVQSHSCQVGIGLHTFVSDWSKRSDFKEADDCQIRPLPADLSYQYTLQPVLSKLHKVTGNFRGIKMYYQTVQCCTKWRLHVAGPYILQENISTLSLWPSQRIELITWPFIFKRN